LSSVQIKTGGGGEEKRSMISSQKLGGRHGREWPVSASTEKQVNEIDMVFSKIA
jgi:hypothetical protein